MRKNNVIIEPHKVNPTKRKTDNDKPKTTKSNLPGAIQFVLGSSLVVDSSKKDLYIA